ncbi:hypothetical protein PC116_g34944 [Phytophthora cactorum]|nr:hypothetical protein PC116_g34944 [Phytophthora cactorum]
MQAGRRTVPLWCHLDDPMLSEDVPQRSRWGTIEDYKKQRVEESGSVGI